MIGSGIGGLNEFETQHTVMMQKGPSRISPFTIPKLMVNAASGQVSIRWGLQGPCSAVATACASAANAIGDALKLIQAGWADVMVTGGSEAAITHMGLGGFASMRALSTRNDDPPRASRPFDRDRDGFVLAEGAGVLILEAEEIARAAGRASTPSCSATACRPTAGTSPPPTRKAAAPPAPCNAAWTTPGSPPTPSTTSTPTAPARRSATWPRPAP